MTIDSLLSFATLVITVGLGWFIGKKLRDLQNTKNQTHFKVLKKAKADLSEPKDVDFVFYFPDELKAQRVARTLRGWEFDAKVQKSGDQFMITFTYNMILDERTLEVLSAKFTELAEENSGEFDGWGSEV